MRVLFVTPHPPSRIRVRSYGFLAQLHHEHEVLIATQCASAQEAEDVESLRRQGFEVVVVQESKRQAMLRSGIALLTSRPLQVAYAQSTHFAETVARLCNERAIDVVHVEHMRGIASMEQIAQLRPLVWDAVDCISLLCKHTIVAGPSLPVRLIARLELERTQRYEARILRQLQHIIVTSERDRQAMLDLNYNATAQDESKKSTITVLPNGVDLDYFSPLAVERRPLNIVFSGKMSYHANVATALYLHKHIMPLIWEQQPQATLTIVGSKPPKMIQQLARDPRIEVTGYVADLRPYVARAQVMVSPMVYSVGIQNKVLEAMALGTPVVVAKQAAQALNAQHEHDMLVADSARAFADATLRLMTDTELHTALRLHGRVYVEQHHNWHVATERLVHLYEQAIGNVGRLHVGLPTRW